MRKWSFTGIVFIVFFVVFLVSSSFAQEEGWKEKTGVHFIIYYKEAPLDFVKSVEKSCEEYYVEIAENLGLTWYKGWNWERRAKVYIYDNADDYVKSGGNADWSSGTASTRNRVIRTYPAAHGFFDTTLPHEIGHLIFREFVGFKAQVPKWFEEGIAMYQEKARRWGANDEVRKALKDGTFKSLSELSLITLSRRPKKESIELFYAESASIVYFIITEFGESRFVRLCRELKDGDKFEWAFQKIYMRFKTLEDLNKAWVDYLEK